MLHCAQSMSLTPERIYVKKRKSTGHTDHTPPGKRVVTDPTRQLLNEYGLQAGTLNRAFNRRLDLDAQEREDQHRRALEAAALEHERVRNDAARAQALLQIAAEQDRQQRELEEQRLLEQQRQETTQRELERELEQKQREVQEAKRIQELRQAAAEAERKAAEIRAATPAKVISPVPGKPEPELTSNAAIVPPTQQPAVQQNTPAAQPTTQAQTPTIAAVPSTLQDPTGARAKHQKYLDLHKRLKTLRRDAGAVADKDLKKRTGELRREIVKSVGQLTSNAAANTAPFRKVMDVLKSAAGLSQPTIDIRDYIVQDIPPNVDQGQCSGGLIQTYLLNIFAKAVWSQFVNEAGPTPLAAEPIGVIAIKIFAAKDFLWQGMTLVDILIAKFHARCPVLFGFGFSNAQQTGLSGEGMTGVGAGFAALSLRDFSKTTQQNPYPPSNFWQSLACILNTPPARVSQVHCILLKAMIENHAGKFIRFFGKAAVVALRKAVVDFPQHAPKGAAASALATLQTTLKRDLHLAL